MAAIKTFEFIYTKGTLSRTSCFTFKYSNISLFVSSFISWANSFAFCLSSFTTSSSTIYDKKSKEKDFT